MNLKDKNVLVVGLARSGAAAAAFALRQGARVTVTDLAAESEVSIAAQRMRDLGIRLELGGHREESFTTADLVVVSPGVPHTIAPLRGAAEAGVPVIGELELASRFISEPMIAVTGTNGKTTVTLLIGEMLRRSGRNVFVGGNIGTPLVGHAQTGRPADVVVVEVSSFQLDTIVHFRPDIGVLLNITEDHMDRYPGFSAYARSKQRIFENQTAGDTAVLNGADPVVRSAGARIAARRLYYGDRPVTGAEDSAGAQFDGRRIVCRTGIGPEAVFDIPSARLLGRHNVENAGAACLAALAGGGSPEAIQETLNDFTVPGHRLEHTSTVDGVDYYNDSKATNVDAVVRALETFSRPVILIMGGRDKGGDFNVLKGPVARIVRKLIVMGEATQRIASALSGVVDTLTAAGMEEAVALAADAAPPDGVVLLSPGCASFDRYTDYAQRGEAFKQAVRRLT